MLADEPERKIGGPEMRHIQPVRPAAGLILGALLAAAWLATAADAQVVEYYHLDAIGNVRALTDASGNVTERHDYLPFGEECTTPACAANPQVGAGTRRKFTGKERDAETGLDYFGARYYGSKIGRFITVDPAYTVQESLVDPQRWNRYAYGTNNPLRYIDPDGRAVVVANGHGPKKPGPNAGAMAWLAYVMDVAFFGVDPGMAVMGVPGDVAGAVPKLARAAGATDDAIEAVRAVTRTPTERLIQHTTVDDLVGAAREVSTGVPHGGQHVKEVREAARGLRARIADINQGLSNPRMTTAGRDALQKELGVASRNLDAAEKALKGQYRPPGQQ
jgi:RHS repeat-associated protein